MKICEWCDMEFEIRDAEEEFNSEFWKFSYSNFRKCLCASCAIEAFNEEVGEVYFENCEKCGVEFDLFEECTKFYNNFTPESGATLTDFWETDILCCDCAIQVIEIEGL